MLKPPLQYENDEELGVFDRKYEQFNVVNIEYKLAF